MFSKISFSFSKSLLEMKWFKQQIQLRCMFVLCCILNTAYTLKPIIGATSVGSLKLSPIGVGTWAWGNRFLWQYSKSDDEALENTFNEVLKLGVNWFDTADSYGTGDLEGRAEELLGTFKKKVLIPGFIYSFRGS